MNDLSRLLLRSGPLAPSDFEPGEHVIELLQQVRVLVIGAGGLGCELLKDLSLIGFRNIDVIDMDTIDLSNLNRQFLFRYAVKSSCYSWMTDVGKPKAVVAADFIMKRVKGVTVTPHHAKIQDFDDDFYRQFSLVICGLDSVDARRWMNATIHGLYDPEDPASIIPLIDGGTEGFKGQSRVIIPGQTSCYECSLDMLTKKTAFPLCTIANTPRLPEHCIEWASVLEWPRVFADKKLDNDDPEHVTWVYETAQDRAKQFNISGVTYSLTQGVIKNIIPAIASTNAIIAASCAQEALKMVTSCGKLLDNYMMYTGEDGIYTYTFQHQKKPNCPVCGQQATVLRVPSSMRLQELIEMLGERQDIQLKRPSIRGHNKSLYMQAPKPLEEATRPNLSKPLSALGVSAGDELTVTDPNLPFSMKLVLQYTSE